MVLVDKARGVEAVAMWSQRRRRGGHRGGDEAVIKRAVYMVSIYLCCHRLVRCTGKSLARGGLHLQARRPQYAPSPSVLWHRPNNTTDSAWRLEAGAGCTRRHRVAAARLASPTPESRSTYRICRQVFSGVADLMLLVSYDSSDAKPSYDDAVS